MSSIVEDSQRARYRRSMKRLSCRKCEGHGVYSLLKGHAPVCPYNNCQCETCSSVMSMRANALIRRFRNRKPDETNALLKTIRSKNGNIRLRIVPKTGEDDDCSATAVTYTPDGGRSLRSAGSLSPPVSPTASLSPTPLSPLSPLSIQSVSPLPPPLSDPLVDYIALLQAQLLHTIQNASLPTIQPILTPSFDLSALYTQQLLLSQLAPTI